MYALSKNGVVTQVSLTGDIRNILDGVSAYGLQFQEHNLYVCNPEHSKILVYNLDGEIRTIVPIPSDVHFLEFTTLPDGKFALLNNANDKIYFVDSTGKLLATTNILDTPDDQLQNLNGIVVGNRLILSEDGKKHVLAFDLNSYERLMFKDLSGLPDVWLGAITYDGGVFYLATSDTIYKFTEATAAIKVAKLPKGNITSMVILHGFAYLSLNFSGAGEIYKVNITDGTISLVVTGLNYPNNLVLSE